MRGLNHHCIVKLLGVVLGSNMMLVRQFFVGWLPCREFLAWTELAMAEQMYFSCSNVVTLICF